MQQFNFNVDTIHFVCMKTVLQMSLSLCITSRWQHLCEMKSREKQKLFKRQKVQD